MRSHVIQRDEIDKQLKTVDRQVYESKVEINAISKTIDQLRNDDLKIQSRLTELKDIDEPEPNSVASLVSTLFTIIVNIGIFRRLFDSFVHFILYRWSLHSLQRKIQ